MRLNSPLRNNDIERTKENAISCYPWLFCLDGLPFHPSGPKYRVIGTYRAFIARHTILACRRHTSGYSRVRVSGARRLGFGPVAPKRQIASGASH